METLSKQQEKEVVRLMTKEFLEYRLGIEATKENICCFSKHIEDFEKEIQSMGLKKSLKESVCFKSINRLHFSRRRLTC